MYIYQHGKFNENWSLWFCIRAIWSYWKTKEARPALTSKDFANTGRTGIVTPMPNPSAIAGRWRDRKSCAPFDEVFSESSVDTAPVGFLRKRRMAHILLGSEILCRRRIRIRIVYGLRCVSDSCYLSGGTAYASTIASQRSWCGCKLIGQSRSEN